MVNREERWEETYLTFNIKACPEVRAQSAPLVSMKTTFEDDHERSG
jgi:hypothetical protein